MKHTYLTQWACLCMYCIATIPLFAQNQDTLQSLDYNQAKNYEIGGIHLKGAIWSDASALINISGLKIGEKVKIPGPKISNALKALWKLGLFSDVQIFQERSLDEIVFLEIQITEISRLEGINLVGVKKSKVEEVRSLILSHLNIGRKLTESKKNTALQALQKYYLEKGYADVDIQVKEQANTKEKQKTQLIFTIDTQEKVKVANIDFIGNRQVSTKKLIKIIGIKTKGKIFSKSKLVEEELIAGKTALIEYYNSLGYLDATIKRDSVWRIAKGDWHISIEITEGNIYYFGNVVWKGHSIYTTKQLATILDIPKGAVFDQNRLDRQLNFSMESKDISSLYMDNGYLFFRAEATQTAIRKDTIDLEIKIFEGPQAIVDKVTIKGNDRTYDHVIRRELRTKPGKKFSRADIIRSQREIVSLGYFNPESLDINTPVNPQNGTVDIEYTVEEKNSDQFELSAGWGGRNVGLTGTVGLTFNNLSLRHLFKPHLWNPAPMGDGQRTSIRFQSNGKAYQSLNFSFTEPWLGGKRPNSLTTSLFYTRYASGLGLSEEYNRSFNIFGASMTFGSRLTFPDDNFVATTSLGYQKYDLKNWASALFTTTDGEIINKGTYHNLSLTQTIARSTINSHIFPTSGSKISLSLQLTAPYSLFNKKDYATLDAADRFNWLEYHKWRFNAEWYTPIAGKLIFKLAAKMGFVGSYNRDIGISPFERFQLGGDGLSNASGGFTGTDIVSLRGYDVEDLENNFINGSVVAAPIFNKFTMEFRYPISLNPNFTVYGLGFLEAGNAAQSFKNYNPFDLKRAAGVGLRVFLPMFGTLGFDYGVGFDKAGERSFNNFGKFSIILGFEPE